MIFIDLQEQLRNFFSKIATTQLGMTLDEYKEMYASHTFEKLVEWLVEKAAETSKTIPDLKGIYESTCEDQKIASRCHNAWEPSAVSISKLSPTAY